MSARLNRKQKRRLQRETDHVVNQKFAMKRITPITDRQKQMFDDYGNGKMIAALGTAGSGKSYVALYLALSDVLSYQECDSVIIIRSAVQTRDQGFQPGNQSEKGSNYEPAYQDIVNDLFERGDAYQIMKQKNAIKFMTTSFLRGLTFNNSVIVVDECQNMTYEELRTIITRVGENSRIIFCGDSRQDDLRNSKNRKDTSGIRDFVKVVSGMEDFSVINFTVDDIVRSGLVKEYIIQEERLLEYA
jgi:phosphate starvation-inducible protein PhoH